MNPDMNELFDKIINVDELKNFPSIERKLANTGEGYIFQENRPTHVIMTYEKFTEYINQSNAQDAMSSIENVETLLNKIGKKIFVDYYYIFKSDNNPEKALEDEGFTLASQKIRSNSARRIFRDNLQIAALNNIISSDRIGIESIEKAKKILAIEAKYEESNFESFDDNDDTIDVKIGKQMRGILTKLIQNNDLSTSVIKQMESYEYSKISFNLNYPVLRAVKPNESVDNAKRDENGYNRYYSTTLMINGKDYLICSQWVEPLNRKASRLWIVEHMVKIVNAIVNGFPSGEQFNIRGILSDYWPYIDSDTRRLIGRTYRQEIEITNDVDVDEKKDGCQYYRKR